MLYALQFEYTKKISISSSSGVHYRAWCHSAVLVNLVILCLSYSLFLLCHFCMMSYKPAVLCKPLVIHQCMEQATCNMVRDPVGTLQLNEQRSLQTFIFGNVCKFCRLTLLHILSMRLRRTSETMKVVHTHHLLL